MTLVPGEFERLRAMDVRIEMRDAHHHSIFGAIEQKVVRVGG